jgi:hypothetical protein
LQNYYSNENRIVNFMARTLDIEYDRNQFGKEKFLDSLNSLVTNSATYNGITVNSVNWDGSYFTYVTPALFVREMDTAYGVSTIDKATEAQISYATDKGYAAWGISDCYDVEDRDYVKRGAPPRGSNDPSNDKDDGLITPHVSALALLTGQAENAKANLQKLKSDYPSVYDDRYGFKDSINLDASGPDYKKQSNTICGLDQGWMLMAIGNYLNSTLHKYFHQNPGVTRAYNEMNNLSLVKVTKTGTGAVTSSPSGIDCGETCSASFAQGAPVTLTAEADTDSTFLGWTGCTTTSGTSCSIAITADVTVTALFSPCTYTVTPTGPKTFASKPGSATLTVKGQGRQNRPYVPLPR